MGFNFFGFLKRKPEVHPYYQKQYDIAKILNDTHRFCGGHRDSIQKSNLVGCFYCCQIYPAKEVNEWIDEINGIGQTALCPKCGIDSILGDYDVKILDKEFLEKMRTRWFGNVK